MNLVPLGEVAKLDRNGIDPAKIDADTKYVGLEHISGESGEVSPAIVQPGELKSSKFIFSSKHVLFGKLRPNLRKTTRVDFSGICSTDIIPILPSAKLDAGYLKHFLRTDHAVHEATTRATGINLPRLSPKQLAEFPIPLPPLAEQKRIAAILDQADALRRLRRQSIDRLNTLAQSVFYEMFGDSNNAFEIGDLLKDGALLVHKDGNHGSNYPRAEEFGESGVPFLSAKCISDAGELIEEENQYLNEEKASKLKIGWLQNGDVLLSHNASVGKVAIYNGEFGDALIGTSLTCFRPDVTHILPNFLLATLRSNYFQNQLFQNMGQTTRNQVPITAQRRLKILVPDLQQQRRYEAFRSNFSAHRQSLLAAQRKYKAIFSSLQQRAFRGEL